MTRCEELTAVCFALLCGLMFALGTSSTACIKVPFDQRRCYEYVDTESDWETARRDCDSRGQRLAVLEDEDLLEYVGTTFPYGSVRTDSVWIGMRREADGFADMWLNGEQLDKAAYPTLEAKVGRVKDANEFCGRINVNGGIGDSNCTHALPSLCETYKYPTFIIRSEGFVLARTDEGHEVTSESALTLTECARKCDDLWDCEAIRHHDARCWLHMTTTAGSFTVPAGAQVYKRTGVYTGAYDNY